MIKLTSPRKTGDASCSDPPFLRVEVGKKEQINGQKKILRVEPMGREQVIVSLLPVMSTSLVSVCSCRCQDSPGKLQVDAQPTCDTIDRSAHCAGAALARHQARVPQRCINVRQNQRRNEKMITVTLTTKALFFVFSTMQEPCRP